MSENPITVVSAIDSYTPLQTGENGNCEFAWSHDTQEQIVQFDFQCVRTDSTGIQELSDKLDGLLQRLSVKQTSVE